MSEKIPTQAVDYIDGKWTSQRRFVSLINEVAKREGIDVKWLSDDWIAQLEKNNNVHFIYGNYFPLNNAGAANVAVDKVATYTVLQNAQIPAVEHYLLRIGDEDTTNPGERTLPPVNFPMVIKPARESGGRNVYKVETPEDARATISRLAIRYQSLAISPFETILSEHRVVMLDGEPQLFYEKKIISEDSAVRVSYTPITVFLRQ